MTERTKTVVGAVIPLLTGVVVGLLTSIAMFSGRVAALETTATVHSEQLRDIRSDLRSIVLKLDR